jgi:uncharacterized membrane protein
MKNGGSGGSHASGPWTVDGATPEAESPERLAEDDAGLQLPEEETAVIVTETPAASRPIVTEAARSAVNADDDAAKVHVAPNLLDLILAPPPTPEEKLELEHTRDLNDVIHKVLVIGLFVSTATMLTGMVLAVIRHRALATTAPEIGSVWARVEALRPSGFLALGILILIATPIFRVLGSFVVFSYEKDWRYAGITLIVLLVLIASLFIGKA